MIGHNYVRVMSIPRLSKCQGSKFPELPILLTRFTYFRKCDRVLVVLNMHYDAIVEWYSGFSNKLTVLTMTEF